MVKPQEKRATNGSTNGDNATSKKTKRDTAARLGPKCLEIKNFVKSAFNGQFDDADLPEGVQIITEPFKCIVIPNFLEDDGFLEDLKKELDYDIEYIPKNNDLYRFRQSDDLKNTDLPAIKSVRECFLRDVHSYLKDVTEIPLFEDIVDLTASKYEYNG